jgi:hypothetical protein
VYNKIATLLLKVILYHSRKCFRVEVGLAELRQIYGIQDY